MATSKSDRTAEEFKQAARRVFARQGYAITKITDITAEAGRATGGIYRYFPSKAAVLKELADDFLRVRHDRVAHSAGHGHSMTTEQDVREHVQAYCRSYRDYLAEMAAIHDAAAADPEFADIRRQIHAYDIAIWRVHIKELRTHLGKPVDQSTALARLVVGLLENHCYTTFHLGEGDSRGSIPTLTRFIYAGIAN